MRSSKESPRTSSVPRSPGTARSSTESATGPRSVSLGSSPPDLPPDHHLGEKAGGHVGFVHRVDRPPRPQDGDPVGDLHHLPQLVGDEDDGVPGLRELADGVEELLALLRGEHRGGLVEDEDFRPAVERLDDLDPLHQPDGEAAHRRVQREVDVEVPPDRLEVAFHLAGLPQHPLPGRPVPEHDVFRDGQGGGELKSWCTIRCRWRWHPWGCAARAASRRGGSPPRRGAEARRGYS